jgi:LmbE family N-acetylglucosaminyl deacetylase
MAKTILVICAHSDDQIFGAGGTMAKYAKEGKKVKTIIFSRGEASHPHMKPEVIGETRVKEAEAADKIIGGNGVIFLGAKEGSFKKDFINGLKEKLKEMIKKENPEKIFTHNGEFDVHPDHQEVYNCVIKIVDELKLKTEVYTFNVWNPWKLKKRNVPKLVVNISETFNKKVKAIHAFKSQVGWVSLIGQTYIPYFNMLSKAFLNGLKHGVKFAEVFYKVR